MSQFRVAMVQARTPKYRRGFYTDLRDTLAQRGVTFDLIQGLPFGEHAEKDDAMVVPWATVVPTRTLSLAGKTLSWRSCVRRLSDYDLVIGQQETALLENYAFFIRQLAGRQRLAFWGHGRNFQNASPVGEAIKRAISTRVHWWFAYNELSANVVRGMGYPNDRITVVNNAIDTTETRRIAADTTPEELQALRRELGLEGSHIGAFVGGMYTEKRIPFLIQACDRIREIVPDFEMLVLGGGAHAYLMDEAAAVRPWLHVLGPRFDEEKVRLLQLADVLLMPGLVGLAILDAFALGLPLVTVADSQHSPEIDYLRHGENGLMLPAGTTAGRYADGVAALLGDRPRRQHMAREGHEDSHLYTMEHMVQRFSAGVLSALHA